MKIFFEDIDSGDSDHLAVSHTGQESLVLTLPVDINKPPDQNGLRRVAAGSAVILEPVTLQPDQILTLGIYCVSIVNWLKLTQAKLYEVHFVRYQQEGHAVDKFAIYFTEVKQGGFANPSTRHG